MKYVVGDTVIAKRKIYKNCDKAFALKEKQEGVIIAIPTSRRFAVVDFGTFKESFKLNDLTFVNKGGPKL